LNKPKRGLLVIRDAIKKIQYDVNNNGIIRQNQLTTVHSDLLQLCLASKNFKLALELLSHDILDINKPSNSSFDPKYLLSFYYYAGSVYTTLKQFDDALFYFEQCLTVPAIALSHIMIEAYKKLTIVSLIHLGRLYTLPKYTSRLVVTQIKPICNVYHELAIAFSKYDQERLLDLNQKYADSFARDKNTGLVKQLQQSLFKKNIQKLTKTFITLSIVDIANKVKLGSAKMAENLILNMIKDGEIYATINQKDGKKDLKF
jgi:COP9 signalosome complex subunit 3